MRVRGSRRSPSILRVLRVFLDLFAGTLGVAAEAFHGIAAREEQRADQRESEDDEGGFVE